MYKQKTNNKKGFTLAEVLVTLAVIGIVAALTIPSLTKSYQEKQLKNAYRKIFSELSRATIMLAADNGGSMANVCLRDQSTADNDCIAEQYSNYIKYLKKCDHTNITGNCWHSQNIISTPIINDDGGLVMYNGAFLAFDSYGGASWPLGYIIVDVNGFNYPNEQGKDIIRLKFKTDGTGFVPADSDAGKTYITN